MCVCVCVCVSLCVCVLNAASNPTLPDAIIRNPFFKRAPVLGGNAEPLFSGTEAFSGTGVFSGMALTLVGWNCSGADMEVRKCSRERKGDREICRQINRYMLVYI